MISLPDSGHTVAARYLEAHPGDVRGLAAPMRHTSPDTVMTCTEQLLARIETAEQGGRR